MLNLQIISKIVLTTTVTGEIDDGPANRTAEGNDNDHFNDDNDGDDDGEDDTGDDDEDESGEDDNDDDENESNTCRPKPE